MPPYPTLPGQWPTTSLFTRSSLLSRRSPIGPGNRDDQSTSAFPNGPLLDDDDDDEGFDLSPAAITGITVAIVVAFILAIGFCFYRERGRRRQRKREKHVEIALKEHSTWSQSQPNTPMAPARRIESDAPPPYEAAHLGSRQSRVVHQWDPRGGNGSEANGGEDAVVADGIPPEVPAKHSGLRIGS